MPMVFMQVSNPAQSYTLLRTLTNRKEYMNQPLRADSQQIKMSTTSKDGTYLFEWDLEVYPGKVIEFVKTKDGRLGYTETDLAQVEAKAREGERELIDKQEIVEVFCDWDGKTPDFCDCDCDFGWSGGYSTKGIVEESLYDKEPGFYKIRYYCSFFEGQISHPETGQWDISPGLEIEREFVRKTGEQIEALQKEEK